MVGKRKLVPVKSEILVEAGDPDNGTWSQFTKGYGRAKVGLKLIIKTFLFS